ncbi:hypothetical protein PQ462_15800 [Flavobacterium sp. KACC 22758]|jgi:hypothetical protein|uniref:hypothetical protein n=1 Tax=Flavobacterium sp. KACC 22758 TaxID=3025667 RepID=UPI002366EEF6|nr:hypothetical protein [Flavobacterium sp. KACC 22758]WDF58180.1 hypothetical protein PQ462_15800 [Flavobacterium sp. KACC 22758]
MLKYATKEYSILSDKFSEFSNEEQFPPRINTNDDSVPEVFKNYEYPVTSWPILINKEIAEELKELSQRLPRLLNKIPSLYFNNDIKKIADFYFEGNEILAEFGMMCHDKNIQVGCRLDLTYTEDGFKILEANMGSSLGGWQIHSLESVIRRNHPELRDEEKSCNYKTRNTLKIYMEYLIEQIRKQVGKEKSTLNLFIDMRDIEASEREKNLSFFDSFYREELKKQGLGGQAYSANINSLELVDGELYFENVVIHGVIILALDVEITPAIFRAFIMDKIYFPDHVGLRMLGDKRNLAILRELAQSGKLSPRDSELMLRHIPWTSPVKNKATIFKGAEYNLPQLLKKNKSRFVIKASRGYQGKDVFIGKFTDDKEWEEILETALKTGAFIAQEFSDSVDFTAPNQQNEWTPHKLIWGAFGFGDFYGGVWVRMSEVKTDVGVINSATGAVEAIVFEILS